MAPRKTVQSLYKLSLETVTYSMKEASNSLQLEDYVTDKIDEIKTYYGNLPEEIQHNLADNLLHMHMNFVVVFEQSCTCFIEILIGPL